MTRGMFVTVLGRFANADTRMYTSSRFHDVDMGRYFGPYVEWAADVDIVEGVTATKFSPDASITLRADCGYLIPLCPADWK